VTLETFDDEADGTSDRIVRWRYGYQDDANSKVIRIEHVDAIEDVLVELETWQHDANGRVMRYECEGRDSCDGVAIRHSFSDYRLEFWQYHANGKVRLHDIEETYDDEANGRLHYRYDASGNLTRYEHGLNFPGYKTDDFVWWQYDSNGRLARSSRGYETWQYDADGNLIHEGRSDGGDSYQYEATGWGYLFSEVEVYFHSSFPPPEPRAEPSHPDPGH